MDHIIDSEGLKATFCYLDNITICGNSKDEHDNNLQAFNEVSKKYNLTFNDSKSIIFTESLSLLGYCIRKGELRPDPDRMKPLVDLEPPKTPKALKRVMGFFSYYSQWIPNFAHRIGPLSSLIDQNKSYQLTTTAVQAFQAIKKDILLSVKATIDESLPFVVETDASDVGIAATLNQGGRPVVFFSRTLTKPERGFSAIEKEATAIIESLRKWKHYLLGKKFLLLTDQRSLSFMLNPKAKGKIKNEKIARWRLDLSSFCFDINYRKGKDNCAPDMLSRSFNCALVGDSKLLELHKNLCHPGIARLIHFIRTRNLPYSVDDVKRVVGSCVDCAKLKPNFGIRNTEKLIRALNPFDRVSIDFKGPLPTASRNKYILTIVDEYSRFPFAYPCADMNSSTVINCLNDLFSTFGRPGYIHSDRGRSFMSSELKEYLVKKGVASSHSTPYNPEGNSQCERFNGIIWKTVQLALASKKLDVQYWEMVLPEALHSIRSLLCTATNETPHERLFKFHRRSTHGTALPSWLLNSNKVLLKRHVRHSKYDPLVDEVDLLETNPTYANVRHADGREAVVSLKHLSPLPAIENSEINKSANIEQTSELEQNSTMTAPTPSSNESPTTPQLRRSTRLRREPDRLTYDHR